MVEEKVRVLGRNVLVEPILDEVTDSGIIVKRDFQPIMVRGKVLAKGDDIRCRDVQVDDIVYYHKLSGKPVPINNKKLIIMDIIEVQAVEEKD